MRRVEEILKQKTPDPAPPPPKEKPQVSIDVQVFVAGLIVGAVLVYIL